MDLVVKTADLVIKNCKVVTPSATFKGGVAISGGKIVAVASDENLPQANEVTDGRGNFLLPGIIDVHVHFREPGYEYKEDFSTGSAAAAAGGVTAVFDMPSGIPQIDTAENFNKKVALIQGRSHVDYGLYAMVTDDNLNELKTIAELGAIGFKLYMSKTAVKVSVPSDGSIVEGFRTIASTGLSTSVHAENDDIIDYFTEKVRKTGRTDILSYAEGRPSMAEAEAIQRVALIAHYTGNRIHILHLSSNEGLKQVSYWKQRGVKVTAETCPHYLLLTPHHLEKLGSISKINPPIKSEEDLLRLWDGILDGTIDIIATDHSPHPLEEKAVNDVWIAAAGFAGVETNLPLMLTKVKEGKLSLERYVQLAAENPAKIFGLYPRKGSISLGSDADLVLVDMSRESVIKSEKLHSKTRVTPFENWRVNAVPIFTMLRGEVIAHEGEVVGPPKGRMVKRFSST